MTLWSLFPRFLFGVAVGVLGLTAGFARAEPIAKLLPWVPADANAVVTIDVESMFRTPLAMRENWRKQAGDRFANQEIVVPPEAQRVVMASQLDLGGGLQPVWELGIMDVERTPSFALIARREGGHLDTIAGHSAVTLPGGRSGVELDPGVILVTSQPNRQVISRWIGTAKKETSRLSPFLAKGLEQADPKSHLVVVMDLADSVTAAPLR